MWSVMKDKYLLLIQPTNCTKGGDGRTDW